MHHPIRTSIRAVGPLAVLLGLALLAAAPATAQIPDEFKNLQVLPKDMGKQDLIGIMRSWTEALGERCSFCQVGPDNLQGMDFATDDKEPKRVARAMVRMVGEINGKLLPATGREEVIQVRCMTCHRGVDEPETIDRILLRVASDSGVTAALERYAALREEHYGDGSYDFSPGSLSAVAEALASQRNDVDGAIAVSKANAEYHPDKAQPHVMLGQLYATKGDREAAIAELERALAIEPDNRWARRQLDQLKPKPQQ